MYRMTCFYSTQGDAFGGRDVTARGRHLGVKRHKTSILGINKHFQAKLVKYQHLHNRNYSIDSNHILHSDK